MARIRIHARLQQSRQETDVYSYISAIYVISSIIPIFVGLDICTLNYMGFVCNQFKWEISRNICNGSPRYLELNQIEESGK